MSGNLEDYLGDTGALSNDANAKSFNDQLNAYLAQINTITTNMAGLESLRTRVATLIEQINKEIETWNSKVTDQNLNAVAFTQFIAEWFDSLHQILIEKTISALNSSREFRAPFFATRLLEIVMNEGILDLTMDFATSSTIQNSIMVFINMDSMAGDIKEYLLACVMAKDRIKNEGAINPVGALTRNNPDVGARVFEEKYYGVDEENNRVFRYRRRKKRKFIQVEFNLKGKKRTASEKRLLADIAAEKNKTEAGGEDITAAYRGKYHNTLLERAKLFTHPAPFWSILENGSVGGGDVIPQARTNFVAKSKKAIQVKGNLEYNKIRKKLETKWGKEFDDLVTQRTRAESLFDEINVFIERTQSKAMQALIQFRENPAELIQKQTYISSVIAQKLLQTGKVNPSAVAEEIHRVAAKVVSGNVGPDIRVRILGERYRLRIPVNSWLQSQK